MPLLISLHDRALIRLTGEDTRSLLQGIITTDANKLAPDYPLFACILTPQGKWLHEFFIVDTGDAILLDTHIDAVESLIKTLKKYRLRAKVTIEDLGADYTVHASLNMEAPEVENALIYRDPRHKEMGWRIVTKHPASLSGNITDYITQRLSLGIPDGVYDATERSLPIELGYDLLGGIDFEKGCYVGQEVTARMHYRNVRRRIPVIVTSEEVPPKTDTTILIDNTEIGAMRSCQDNLGLAIIKYDALHGSSNSIWAQADSHNITLHIPHWLQKHIM